MGKPKKETGFKFEENQAYMLFDNTFLKQSAFPMKKYLDTENLEPVITFDLEHNSRTFLDYLNKVLEKTKLKGVITEEILLENISMNLKGEFFLEDYRKNYIENYNASHGFAKELIHDQLDNLSPFKATTENAKRILHIIDRMKGGNFTAEDTKKCKKILSGSQLGDISIKKIIDENPSTEFFVVTSDNMLGFEVNLRQNSGAMNFSGFYASLAESGVLTKLGFTEEGQEHLLPSGNEIVRNLKEKRIAGNYSVTISDKFETYLSEKIGLKFTEKRTSQTSFKDILKNNKHAHKLIELMEQKYAKGGQERGAQNEIT